MPLTVSAKSTPPEALLNDEGNNFDPFKDWDFMMKNEKPGGHGERSVAVGTIDRALWDVVTKIAEKPLYQVVAERFNNNQADRDVFVYAAGGYYYPEKDKAALCAEMKTYLDRAYNMVKIKIGSVSLDEDLARIEAVLELLDSNQSLAVDANGHFNLKTAMRYLEALEDYPLFWYEEPCNPLDYLLNAAVSAESRLPIATGENIFSLIDAKNLIRYGDLRPEKDYLQFDPALSYGLGEYIRILEILNEHVWSWKRCIPHGGHQLTLHIAAGLGLGGNETYPHVFKPFGGFGDEAEIVEGKIKVSDIPGIGFELKSERMECFDQSF